MSLLSEQDWITITSVINKINQSKNEKSMRRVFLEAVEELIPYDMAIFDLSMLDHGEFVSLYDPIIKSKFSKQFEESFIGKYDNEYYMASYTRWIHYEKEPRVYNETEIINELARKNSKYYKQYLEPEGLIYVCGCNVIAKGINFGAITFYRTEASGDFDKRVLRILSQLQPHVITKLSQCINYVYEYDVRERFIMKYGLTDREFEIGYLVAEGLGNEEIAEKLFISVHTVKKHMTNIFGKLEIKRRTQVGLLFRNHGLK